MKEILRILIYTLNIPIYWLSLIVPKDKNLWVFGSWFGKKFGDNSKYLFEYVNKNHPEIIAIWLTKDKKTMELVRKKGYKAHLTYSFKGYLLSIRAKVGVLSVCISDINLFTVGKMQLVQLWHGIPLKKIMHDDKITRKPTKNYKENFPPFLKRCSDYSDVLITSTSECVQKSMASAFQAPVDNVKITGYPRNDCFFDENTEKVPLTAFINTLKQSKMRIGIYMPTHRKEGKFCFSSFLSNELEKIDAELQSKNVFLFIKMHFYHLKNLELSKCCLKNIKFITEEDINQDIYTVLPDIDFLITDYSGIYFDYLLFNKPIIFFPFDIEDYLSTDREFYYNYDEIVAGPKAKNWDEVLKYIDEAVNYPDKYKAKREKIKDMFHKYPDGNSSKRVFEEIMKEIA